MASKAINSKKTATKKRAASTRRIKPQNNGVAGAGPCHAAGDRRSACDCDVIHGDVVETVCKMMKSRDEYVQLASLYAMFADGTRVKILHALECGEMCVCDLAVLLGMTKSAISHQLKFLRLANLVRFRKEAQIVFYSLADSHVKDILDRGFEHVNE